jgi:hypothetical protein
MKRATLPVCEKDKDGKQVVIILWDMYADGKWIGSRRTLDQCEDYFRYLTSK